MTNEIHHPRDRDEWLALRAKDVTSTTVSALFGVNPHITKFELWHRIHDGTPFNDDMEGVERVMWGNLLQAAIAEGVAKTQGWKLRQMTEYIRDPVLGLGASFDYSIEGDTYAAPDAPKGVLEIKNVDSMVFKTDWEKDEGGAIEAPPHIEIQLATQLMVSDRPFGYIAPLIGGNELKLIRRERSADVCETIRTKVGEFRASIEEHREPTPEFRTDCGFISKLYGVTPDKTYDGREDTELSLLVAQYDDARIQEKAHKELKDAAKAAILYKIKDAERVWANGFSVWAGQVKGGPRQFVAPDYRGWKVTVKK